MRQKSDILLNLTKNGWTVHTNWTVTQDYLMLRIEAFSSCRAERPYTLHHWITMENLSYIKEKDYLLNTLELELLNKLYNAMLDEQGTKVL